jgi:hypothetical protein
VRNYRGPLGTSRLPSIPRVTSANPGVTLPTGVVGHMPDSEEIIAAGRVGERREPDEQTGLGRPSNTSAYDTLDVTYPAK